MAKTTKAKALTRAQLVRRVAQQHLWCVVDKRTGEIAYAFPTRKEARYEADDYCLGPDEPSNAVIIRVDLRVKGARA